MTELICKKGQHDFKPNIHPVFLSKKRNRCNFSFVLQPSMWYHPDQTPDSDYTGWNKLGFGFTQGLFTNTKRSCMVAEFPHAVEGFHNIAFYINDKKGDWKAQDMMVAEVGKTYRGFIVWLRYTTIMRIWEEGKEELYNEGRFQLTRSNWLPLRGLGAWHGGRYPAPQDRKFLAKQNYVT